MDRIQVTLFSTTGKYKPISTIVKIEKEQEDDKQLICRKAIENICHYRYTSWDILKSQGYTKVKTRIYDLEKIEAERQLQERINLLKKIQEERKNK